MLAAWHSRRLAALPAVRARAREARAAASGLSGLRLGLLGELDSRRRRRARARRAACCSGGEQGAAPRPLGHPRRFPGGGGGRARRPPARVREETGIEIEPIAWVGTFIDPYSDRASCSRLTLARSRRRRAACADDVDDSLVRTQRAAGRDGVSPQGGCCGLGRGARARSRHPCLGQGYRAPAKPTRRRS